MGRSVHDQGAIDEGNTTEDWPIALKFSEWWEHNKEALLAKRYEQATWLPAATVGQPTPAKPAPQAPAPLAPAGSPSSLKWPALAAVVLAALALGWRLRRRN